MRRNLGISFFIHPIPIAAVLIMAANDHVLKYHYPSFLTGKLSDFAGLFFFPLFICALLCVFLNFTKPGGERAVTLTQPMLIVAILISNLVFIAVKLWPLANGFYVQAMFALGFPSRLIMDTTDLIALSASAATYAFGRRYFIKIEQAASSLS